MTYGTPVLITAPTADVVTLAAAKAHLRVDSTDDDALITALVAAVVNQLDPAGGGWLGRALRPQTWELRLDQFRGRDWVDLPYSRLDRFPGINRIDLPYPVLTELTSVKYNDSAGVEQTMVEGTDYRVFGLNGHPKAFIAPVFNGIWPIARPDIESVRIRYQCGYATTPADTLPAPIVAWIKLQLGKLYEQREAVIVGARVTVASLPDVDGLVWPYRVF